MTDDALLAREDFAARARRVLEAAGGEVALHLRGHATPVRRLLALAEALAGEGVVLVNDRIDVALAAGVAGAQLGRRSVPPPVARRLLGPGALLGYSAHGAGEAVEATEAGTDFVLLGTIYASASHPGVPGAGSALVRAAAGLCSAPVLAIGGLTPERVGEVLAAGAHGVAVLGGVWHAADPEAAAGRFRAALAEA